MAGDMNLFPRLGFIQFTIQRAEPRRNLETVASALQTIDHGDTMLIVLPEMWSCGFAYGQLGEMACETGDILSDLAVLAQRHNCIFAGSLPEKIDQEGTDLVYNTLYITGARGVLGSYRKQRIFAFGGEGEAFAPGENPGAVITSSGNIGCLVCYDLRFPDLARIQCQQGADLLVCSAEWPTARIEHWRTLLKARAIENQTFLVACNSCGSIDGVQFGGSSAIIDPEGKILAEASVDPQVTVIQADWQIREDFRSRFRSFASAPYSFVDALKICGSAADCLERVSRRKAVGQKVLFYELAMIDCDDIDLKGLEEKRRQGDFLLVGVSPEKPLVSGERQGMRGKTGARTGILRFLAALGCVDAVCSLEDFSPKDLTRLGQLLAQ